MTRQLIAILRGVRPKEVEGITEALIDAGIDKIEVPLNSPDAFESIEKIVKRFFDVATLGAGTVLRRDEVERLALIGAQMIVSPNFDQDVVALTKKLGMWSYPGVMTPTECFSALKAGADGLKIFPGELVTPKGLKAMRAVLPKDTLCLAVGGARIENFEEWKTAGADGFGIGTALYKAGDLAADVKKNAKKIVAAYDEVMG